MPADRVPVTFLLGAIGLGHVIELKRITVIGPRALRNRDISSGEGLVRAYHFRPRLERDSLTGLVSTKPPHSPAVSPNGVSKGFSAACEMSPLMLQLSVPRLQEGRGKVRGGGTSTYRDRIEDG